MHQTQGACSLTYEQAPCVSDANAFITHYLLPSILLGIFVIIEFKKQ